jgi:hypothetical protein
MAKGEGGSEPEVLSPENPKIVKGYVTYRFQLGDGELRRRVSALTRDGRCDAFYVGITSGDDCLKALRSRMDAFKAESGLHEIVVIAETDNAEEAADMERELEAYNRVDDRCLNQRAGGGGRRGKGPRYFVYVAIRRPASSCVVA